MPPSGGGSFRWQGLLDAPVILLPFADPKAYVDRYAEPDKAATGLGAGTDAWPAPYWTVDASMAVMTLLLAAEDAGLGALFFGVFNGRARAAAHARCARRRCSCSARSRSATRPTADRPRGRVGARRGRARTPDQIIHRGGW